MVLYNNILNDHFYMKSYFLNSGQVNNGQPYGNAAIGPSYRFMATDFMSDTKFVIVGSQAYQSSYMSC
jgi:hypothetical protein